MCAHSDRCANIASPVTSTSRRSTSRSRGTAWVSSFSRSPMASCASTAPRRLAKDRLQSGSLMSPPSPLTADELEALTHPTHDDRLQLLPLLDGLGQLIQRIVVEHAARVP